MPTIYSSYDPQFDTSSTPVVSDELSTSTMNLNQSLPVTHPNFNMIPNLQPAIYSTQMSKLSFFYAPLNDFQIYYIICEEISLSFENVSQLIINAVIRKISSFTWKMTDLIHYLAPQQACGQTYESMINFNNRVIPNHPQPCDRNALFYNFNSQQNHIQFVESQNGGNNYNQGYCDSNLFHF
ncbi:hypothetical protein GLOIN_2v1469311 [Rhizophagus clarus]|uniref:Uncharacterized protein n=1 Tax=Rhizophagus clarus TaxID=94130 RepID=A0A8H3QZS5_9GLOM|nr:hypothetical protein GLOIN_2v1469311 [Rhizophagus clarus]